jgi:competence protein ComEC
VIAPADLARRPHCLVAALCGGIAIANVARPPLLGLGLAAAALTCLATIVEPAARLPLAAATLALVGWWWGSARLDQLDRSVLASRVGTSERARVVVTGTPRRGRFEARMPARVLRFGRLQPNERVLLELPLGRSPPVQGALLDVLGVLVAPRGPENGFDERTWLRRQGVHVVLRGDRWRLVGHRHGLAAVPDRLHAWVGRSVAPRLHGERRALLVGVVLGDDQGLDETLRQRFRAAGLYHLLAVSGQNVALIAAAILMAAWLVGIPRVLAELGALVAMTGYVLAVGPQPSVIRAGVAGGLASVAWLTARARDRWYMLLLGALVLLAWNPYVVFDAGFELSFAAVVAIFVLVPRLLRRLEGYPVPRRLAEVVAVSTACGVATAPITWIQFHSVPLLTVPANALAFPAVVPLLGLALATVAAAPFAPGIAAELAWLNGWCAAYLAACARAVGGLPGAQIRSGKAAAGLALGALLAAAYAWRRWRRTT